MYIYIYIYILLLVKKHTKYTLQRLLVSCITHSSGYTTGYTIYL